MLHLQFGRSLHKLVTSLLRFGFRRLEKDKDGRKADVEDRNLRSQEVEDKNQTASWETAKERYEKRRTMAGHGFRKEWLSEFNRLEYRTEPSQRRHFWWQTHFEF